VTTHQFNKTITAILIYHPQRCWCMCEKKRQASLWSITYRRG